MDSNTAATPASSPTAQPDVKGFITASRAKGVPDAQIYSYLQQKGYVGQKPAPASDSGYVSRVIDTAKEGVSQIHQAGIEGTQGKNPIETGLKAASGAATAITAPISAALSPIVTPVIHAAATGLNTVENAVNGPGFVERFANSPAGHATARATEDIGNGANVAGTVAGLAGAPKIAGVVSDATKGATAAVADTIRSIPNPKTALSDAATTITPNMQTLINRVKSNPTEAGQVAAQLKSYFTTAEQGKGVTGAKNPLDVAGAQFKPAMTALKRKMSDTGTAMKDALAPVAGTKASGIGDVLQHLKDQTSERLGAEYTPMSDTSGAMDAMNFKQRVAFLNDVIDGKQPDPFGGDGVFRSATGREIAVSSAPDLKKLADLHETLANLGENPTVQQLHDTVQRLQSDLYKAAKVGAEPIDSNVKGLMKQTAGMLNERAKEAAMQAEQAQGLPAGRYADAKSQYGDLSQLQQDMSRRLGVNYKQAPSLIKKIFSPQNQGLNVLVDRLEKETGTKIFDHATLADFAMRSVGDPRIKSMLEQVQSGGLTKHSFVMKFFDYVASKLEDPRGKALRQLGDHE